MRFLLDEPHSVARKLVGSGAPVYVTVDPIEYHGPHLSLHNDSAISQGFVREMHTRLQAENDWPFLLGGAVDAGADPVPGPGTRPVAPNEVFRRAWDAVRSVVELGAKRVVLMTFHGSPRHVHAVFRCIRKLERMGIQAFFPTVVLYRTVVDPDVERLRGVFDRIGDEGVRRQLLERPSCDFHAGFLETSAALHWAPETVNRHDLTPPCPQFEPDRWLSLAARAAHKAGKVQLGKELRFLSEALGWYRVRPFPGYSGWPHLANPEAGELIARELVGQAVALAGGVFDGSQRAPAPILGWTTGGRLAGWVNSMSA